VLHEGEKKGGGKIPLLIIRINGGGEETSEKRLFTTPPLSPVAGKSAFSHSRVIDTGGCWPKTMRKFSVLRRGNPWGVQF